MATNKRSAPVRLTPRMLRRLVEEEMKGFGGMEPTADRGDAAEETDADEYAGTVEHPVDWLKAGGVKESTLDGHVHYMKALKLEEARLSKRLGRIREALKRGARKLIDARIA